MRNLFVTITLLVLLVAGGVILAQDDDGGTISVSGTSVQVLPLSTVTDSAPVILDITDTTARVNFIGTEPLACYLLYGTDENFGAITNDPDMAQSAIVEHNPVMLNLEPDTEYVFRMQGVSEDGLIYVSELYSFKTLPASDTASANLLAPSNGATVTAVSSNFGDQPNDGRWGILNAFDGNNATEWSSNGDGDNAYFEVQLADTYHINTIEYRTRAMRDGSAITEAFTITTDSGETFGPFELPGNEEIYTFDVDFTTSTLRFDVDASTGGNTGIVDVAVYGSPVD